jgi:hypothetical protein
MRKSEFNELRPFEKGIDFILYFKGRKFTIENIKDRYQCSYRQALRMKNSAAAMVNLIPSGYAQLTNLSKGHPRYLWEILPERYF